MDLRVIEKAAGLVDEHWVDIARRRNKALRFPSGAAGNKVRIESEQ